MAQEDPKERVDRELNELLQELRVALPGVQVLLAFLFTVPFSQRFPVLDSRTKAVYFAAIIATALASLLFIAPTAHHRMQFRSGNKEQVLLVGNWMARGGLLCLAVAVGAAVYVVTDVVYGTTAANVVGILTAVGALVVWFLVPALLPTGNDTPADGAN